METANPRKSRRHELVEMGTVRAVVMMTVVMVIVTLLADTTVAATKTTDSDDVYMERRRQVVNLEKSMRLGARQTLNEKERFVNQRLMEWKRQDITKSLWEGTPFPPELHFFHARPLIDKSEVFQFIRQMPKGGNLHVHFGATVSLDWFVRNVTYRPHCYVCRQAQDNLPLFYFFLDPPHNAECPWKLVSEERNTYSSPEQYDTDLASNISVVVEDPTTAYPSIRSIWQRFEPYFVGVLGAVSYRPVFSDYLWRTLQEALYDGVTYMEIRFTVELYDLDGTYNDEVMVEMVQEVVYNFKQQHPDFVGANIVIASMKSRTVQQQMDAILSTARLHEKYPDEVLGFDLVQHEDTAPSLLELLHVLKQPATQRLPFFLHAGETAWTELTDENLIDAVLLNTTRIGHGYALLRHPWVLEQVKERGIAIEINPLSNQVLKLVTDLRNHPGTVFLSLDYPVVIASDDPATWGAVNLSHDFYVTFMALASTQDDLKVLKQLAINSFRYSGLREEEKAKALEKWEQTYNSFIDRMYQLYS